jgi:TM2 domain-containing membrane protein YozV
MKNEKTQDNVDVNQMVALEQELHELKMEHGIEEKEGRISHAISGFFDRQEAKKQVPLNKKTYLLLALFTGWMGGHRFYAKQYPLAMLYLLLFWTGFGAAMTIIDLLIVIPKQVDENGMICM